MDIPGRTEAMEWLRLAEEQNPGGWIPHSHDVARAAERIARAVGLDADAAYVLGLLHDIGRYEGVRGLHHVIAGYELLCRKGYPDAARICLSHSFQVADIDTYMGEHDVSDAEMAMLLDFLEHARYDDYDRLIQLCDAITMGGGVCLMEKRIVDVALRHGSPPKMIDKWKKLFEIKAGFEQRIGASVYSLFKEVVEYTFKR